MHPIRLTPIWRHNAAFDGAALFAAPAARRADGRLLALDAVAAAERTALKILLMRMRCTSHRLRAHHSVSLHIEDEISGRADGNDGISRS